MTRHPPRNQDIEAVSAKQPGAVAGTKKFGTFAGVFTPTLLTILGVIMYLRTGWVMGNAGVLGGLAVILLAFGITIATGLSMASVTTNIRIGAGGAYSIIAQSLGIEVGGSVGVPLFLSQALAVAMYVFGFREGWRWIFPGHPALLVDLAMFGMVLAIALVSASFAFRVQYFIMAVIAASLVSVAAAAATGSMQYDVTHVGMLGSFAGSPEDGFTGTSFWAVFAVFFPAATGIMAGANMSGDLKDPRRSIPIGTMAAIGVSLVIYLLVAYWLARSATPEELVSDYTIMMEKAYWGPAVLAGLLGATFSSALASIVGAPRVLQALGEHAILPRGDWLSHRTRKGEPRHALYVTAGIVLGALLVRDLNTIAPLITMFFLITYAMINAVVLIEQRLGLASFRPSMSVPTAVPLLGLIGCIFAMFIINPTFSVVAVVLVVGLYVYLGHRSLDAPYGDVRSGLFYAVAEWAAKQVSRLRGSQERAWRPNLLVPFDDPNVIRGEFRFLRDITYPKGSITLLGLASEGELDDLDDRLVDIEHAFKDEDIFVGGTTMGSADLEEGTLAAIQAMRGSMFRPNIVFLPVTPDEDRTELVLSIADQAPRYGLGALLFAPHPDAGLGRRRRVNLWIPDQGPGWRPDMDLGDVDLAILTAYKLVRNWDARLTVITHTADPNQREMADQFLQRLVELARLPATDRIVLDGDLDEVLGSAPEADLNVMPLPPGTTADTFTNAVASARGAFVFTHDSGAENALA